MEDVTLGEVYRLLQKVDSTVTAQNSRVRKLETQTAVQWFALFLIGAAISTIFAHVIGKI